MSQQGNINKAGNWEYKDLCHWEISVVLELKTPMHIGDGDILERDIQGKAIKANKVIDTNGKPIIPATSIKGALRSLLSGFSDQEMIDSIFGKAKQSTDSSEDSHSALASAEFHDAYLMPLGTVQDSIGENLGYWNKERQTFIEASTALDRHTNSALDGSLHFTEFVAAGAKFKLTIMGSMTNEQVSLLLNLINTINDSSQENRTSLLQLGANGADNSGCIGIFGRVKVSCLDESGILDWLSDQSHENHVLSCLNELKNEEVQELLGSLSDDKQQELQALKNKEIFSFDLEFEDTFIVNDPSRQQEGPDQAHSLVMLDAKRNPRLPVKSFRGALRSQGERILNSMGCHCCNTEKACQDPNNLCLACQLFGAKGWQTTVEIGSLIYTGDKTSPFRQEFVAIDRFHGGGKKSAKFNSEYALKPKFKGSIALSSRVSGEEVSWRKGFLALILRDLFEGDINFGASYNKGYGSIKPIASPYTLMDSISADDIESFRSKCKALESENIKLEEHAAKKISADYVLPKHTPLINRGFHNPYHFVPTPTPNTTHWFEKSDLRSLNSPHSHAIYHPEKLHGRIICKLTTESETFVGGQDNTNNDDGEAKIREHFKFGEDVAIPATSLRGTLSSLSEAASNSAMRVLENGVLSYRKTTIESLSAIGIITERKIGDETCLKLIPLALPTLNSRNENGILSYTVPKSFQTMFPNGEARLKVYLNQNQLSDEMKTWTVESPVFYCLDTSSPQQEDFKITNNDCCRHPGGNTKFLIGQNFADNAQLIQNSPAGTKRGILRVLGGAHRCLHTKVHELFIPVADEFADNHEEYLNTQDAFDISDEAIHRFELLAKERTESQKEENVKYEEQYLPYHLKGTSRQNDQTIKLKHGDLVYFRPNEDGDKVDEVSFSSIWRGQVDGTVYDFFDDRLLPFNSSRQKLSPAEMMFGFVQQNESDNQHALSYQGKVNITHAKLHKYEGGSPQQENVVMLKALSTPKLPSPSLYFKHAGDNQAYISKKALNEKHHQAQGRKMYLHAMRNDDSDIQKLSSTGGAANAGDNKYPWLTHHESKRPNLKSRVKPLKKNTEFYFEIKFNNLSEWELGLLCFAVKPNGDFRHKIGMGKPIGLGTVNLEIAAIQTIDRQKRYVEQDISDERYNSTLWKNDHLKSDIPSRFNVEFEQDSANHEPQNSMDVESLIKEFKETMHPEILNALTLLGNPNNIASPVHYPQVDRADIETNNYQWFVANDLGDNPAETSLEPITKQTTGLSTLRRL